MRSTVNIEHAAIYAKALEEGARFFENSFHGKPNAPYVNPTRDFSSYFLRS